MSKYTLSQQAAKDLANIFRYTSKNFSVQQAESYLLALEQSFLNVAAEPNLAHKVADIRQGYYRYLCRKHAIYFNIRENDIFIVRVLHQQMKYELHLTS